jgi:hypothetical protein
VRFRATSPSGRIQIAKQSWYFRVLAKELYATGNVTAFSDELKQTGSLSNDFIESLANLKHLTVI